MAETGLGGSNDSFISFAFAVTSVLLIVLYIPWIIGVVRQTVLYYHAPKKQRLTMENPLANMKESLIYTPHLIAAVVADPHMIIAGFKICMQEKIFFLRCVLPKFAKFMFRPRILILWLWFLLLSSVMYATLTFDPYAILGIPASSSTSDIKKAYRALSKLYHPDQNRTMEARDLYIQIRRAYKALVDREAYEEETRGTQEFSVGVALPHFLISREHDGLVLIGLLSILIIVPLVIWRKFLTDEKIPHLLWQIRFDKERVEHFMKHFGIPEDPKYVERRNSRQAILRTLIALNILPPHAREDVVNTFPPFPDFIQRCVESNKNMTFLKSLGLNEAAIKILHDAMVSNGIQLLDEYEKARMSTETASNDESLTKSNEFNNTLNNNLISESSNNNNNKTESVLISTSAYKATRYLFKQHTIQVEKALDQLQTTTRNNLASVRKLFNLHEEMYELLDLLYSKRDKPNKQLITKLMAMPQRVSEVVDSIEPEICTLQRRIYKNYLQQMNGKVVKNAGRGVREHDIIKQSLDFFLKKYCQ